MNAGRRMMIIQRPAFIYISYLIRKLFIYWIQIKFFTKIIN